MNKNLLALVATLLLGGCTAIATTISDEPVQESKTSRSLGERFDDRILRSKALINIAAQPRLESSNIEVYSYESQILLIGQVPSSELTKVAENAVKPLRDLRGIKNLLAVGDNMSVVQQVKDKLIATKLRTKFLLNDEAAIGNVKVAVEDSEVYLYGLATKQQTDLAINLAKETAGVTTVVTAIQRVE